MEGPASSFCQTVDQVSDASDPCYHSENARLCKATQEHQISCPKNIDDFLALYRHEDWSIQEFLDCLEDPKPSRNMSSALQEKNIIDPYMDLVVKNVLSISATENAAKSTVPLTNSDTLRADTRRAQNRKSQQRYRLKLKSSTQPHKPHPRTPKPKAQPTCPQHTPISYSCQRLHRAMLTILGSRKEADTIFQQRTTGSSSS
jgi:hypothetical protein